MRVSEIICTVVSELTPKITERKFFFRLRKPSCFKYYLAKQLCHLYVYSTYIIIKDVGFSTYNYLSPSTSTHKSVPSSFSVLHTFFRNARTRWPNTRLPLEGRLARRVDVSYVSLIFVAMNGQIIMAQNNFCSLSHEAKLLFF